jgi:hypothetical protein
MNIKTKIVVGLLSASASFSSFADQRTFEFTNLNSGMPMPGHMGLDLNQVSKVTMTADVNDFPEKTIIEKVEFIFPYANNLVVENLKFNGNEYVGIAEDTWVYSKLKVVLMSSQIEDKMPMNFSISVLDSDDLINNAKQSSGYQNLPLADVFGTTQETTQLNVADIANTSFQGKPLTLKLDRHLVQYQGGTFMKMDIDWLGHGQVIAKVYAPMPYTPDSSLIKFKSLTVLDGPSDNKQMEITYFNGTSEEMLMLQIEPILFDSGLL